MIHVSKISEIVRRLPVFSITWVAADGELVHIEQCRMTSFHGSGDTMNVMILASGEVRKVNRLTMTELNGEEVVL